jgi:hypothetical protein
MRAPLPEGKDNRVPPQKKRGYEELAGTAKGVIEQRKIW